MDVTHAKHYSSLSLRTAFLNLFCLACEREVCGKTNGDPLHKDNADSERLAQCVNLNSCHSPLQNLRGRQMHVQRSVDRSVVSKKTHFCTICISKAASDNDQLKLAVVKNFAVLQKETYLTRPISLTLKTVLRYCQTRRDNKLLHFGRQMTRAGVEIIPSALGRHDQLVWPPTPVSWLSIARAAV